ncbi:MAG: DUF3750 domain-containing protein [Minisyncoccota bacterium]
MNFEEFLDTERCQVLLFTCPANLPFSFARHSWLVVNNRGDVSRWEVLWKSQNGSHLYKNFYAPLQGIAMFFFSEKYLWGRGRLLGYVEGSEGSLAEQMARLIESSLQVYPYRHMYSLMGPNSNTYVQWILNQFPQSGLRLPRNSFGKNYAIDTKVI